jgi:hypothetical protein
MELETRDSDLIERDGDKSMHRQLHHGQLTYCLAQVMYGWYIKFHLHNKRPNNFECLLSLQYVILYLPHQHKPTVSILKVLMR